MLHRKGWAVLGLGIALYGCGGHSANRPGAGKIRLTRPARPVWCPTSSSAVQAGQSKPNAPAHRSFDTRTLLGHTETQAAALSRPWGCRLRVIERDRRKFVLTADFRPDRVNVVVMRRTVTSVGVY